MHAVTLVDHLADVERETAALLAALGELPGIDDPQRAAAIRAGQLHDLGKVHPTFVTSLRKAGAPPDGGPWAKSGGSAQLRHDRKGFRHELVSALMVLNPDGGLLANEKQADLVAYLVAAHHGKVRLGARALPDEEDERILGVGRAERLDPVTLTDEWSLPSLTLDRDIFELGAGTWGESWATRTSSLLLELGPFRLAFLEAVVRLADWSASARYDEVTA